MQNLFKSTRISGSYFRNATWSERMISKRMTGSVCTWKALVTSVDSMVMPMVVRFQRQHEVLPETCPSPACC